MKRSLRAGLVGALLLFVGVVSLAIWSTDPSEPETVATTPTILQLVQQSDFHEGDRVRVTGDVRVFEPDAPGEYYVLEQDGQFRVAIHGLPLDTLRPLTDERITIEGEFRFEDGVGRYIEVTNWSTPSADSSLWHLARWQPDCWFPSQCGLDSGAIPL